MSQRFFGKEIQVTVAGELPEPVAFVLEGKEHSIVEVLERWPDHGFGSLGVKRPRWWQRRHRTYYRVRTVDAEVFEIYFDRGSLRPSKFRKWFISRKL